MRNIRLVMLARILVPLLAVCIIALLVSVIMYDATTTEAYATLNYVIERLDEPIEEHLNADLERTQARVSSMFTVLIWVTGFSAAVVATSLVIIVYKLWLLPNSLKIATDLARGDFDEKSLNLPNDELGDLVRELAQRMEKADMNIKLLEEARDNAKAASTAKSEFLSNMSHEIRTPINTIIGMTNIALMAQSIERKDYALGKIDIASTHLLAVINDVLDMSKIEADKLELSPEPFIFEELLQKVINIINFNVISKSQKLEVYVDEGIPRKLICDDHRLAQVITNLMSNAVKFTPENGTVILSTKLIHDEEHRCAIQFSVTDTGVGITQEQKARLFVSFEQAESSTSRNYGGTGLGLPIAKRVVELMGGEIEVSSVPGEGATFSFTIEFEKPDDAEENNLTIYKSAEDIQILIVDDDEHIREYLADIARRFNIPSTTATSGSEAIALLKSGKKYDLCFIDWMMPEMNGVELVRCIKEIEPDETIVIMISAFEWDEIGKEANGVGIDKFLPKPIFPSLFVECVNSFFNADLRNESKGNGNEPPERFWGRSALLAEDMEVNREIVIALLEPTALEIECAENGVEAVRMFSENPEKYDIIFMDIQMPEMDGYDATRAIRAIEHENAKNVPIIAMTANVFRDDIDACIEAGMNCHVGKPLDFDNVLQILRRYLAAQKPIEERRKEDRRSNTVERRQGTDRRKGERRKEQ